MVHIHITEVLFLVQDSLSFASVRNKFNIVYIMLTVSCSCASSVSPFCPQSNRFCVQIKLWLPRNDSHYCTCTFMINCLMQDFCWKALKEETGCLNMYKFYGFYIVYLHAGPLLTECTNSLWMTDQRTRELALIQHQCGKYRSGPCITCSILCHICRPPTVSHTSQSALAPPSVLGFMVWPSINVYYIYYITQIHQGYTDREHAGRGLTCSITLKFSWTKPTSLWRTKAPRNSLQPCLAPAAIAGCHNNITSWRNSPAHQTWPVVCLKNNHSSDLSDRPHLALQNLA